MGGNKILVVGQAPSRKTDGQPAFSGRCGSKLASLFGVRELESVADATNLIDEWPGSAKGKGDRFPLSRARETADAMKRNLFRDYVVVLLAGKAVARSFGVHDTDFFDWLYVADTLVAVVPHPSGVNLWWNDPRNEQLARVFFRTVCELADR